MNKESLFMLLVGIIIGIIIYNLITALSPLIAWMLLYLLFGMICFYLDAKYEKKEKGKKEK